jgi:hypothetical protein
MKNKVNFIIFGGLIFSSPLMGVLDSQQLGPGLIGRIGALWAAAHATVNLMQQQIWASDDYFGPIINVGLPQVDRQNPAPIPLAQPMRDGRFQTDWFPLPHDGTIVAEEWISPLGNNCLGHVIDPDGRYNPTRGARQVRQNIVNDLIRAQNNPEARRLMAYEILDYLTHLQDAEGAGAEEFNAFLQNFHWWDRGSIPGLMQEYLTHSNRENVLIKKLIQKLSRPNIYAVYVRNVIGAGLENGQNDSFQHLGYTELPDDQLGGTLAVLALIHNRNVVLYRSLANRTPEQPQNMIRIGQFMPNPLAPTAYIVHTNEGTHFNALRTPQEVQQRLQAHPELNNEAPSNYNWAYDASAQNAFSNILNQCDADLNNFFQGQCFNNTNEAKAFKKHRFQSLQNLKGQNLLDLESVSISDYLEGLAVFIIENFHHLSWNSMVGLAEATTKVIESMSHDSISRRWLGFFKSFCFKDSSRAPLMKSDILGYTPYPGSTKEFYVSYASPLMLLNAHGAGIPLAIIEIINPDLLQEPFALFPGSYYYPTVILGEQQGRLIHNIKKPIVKIESELPYQIKFISSGAETPSYAYLNLDLEKTFAAHCHHMHLIQHILDGPLRKIWETLLKTSGIFFTKNPGIILKNNPSIILEEVFEELKQGNDVDLDAVIDMIKIIEKSILNKNFHKVILIFIHCLDLKIKSVSGVYENFSGQIMLLNHFLNFVQTTLFKKTKTKKNSIKKLNKSINILQETYFYELPLYRHLQAILINILQTNWPNFILPPLPSEIAIQGLPGNIRNLTLADVVAKFLPDWNPEALDTTFDETAAQSSEAHQIIEKMIEENASQKALQEAQVANLIAIENIEMAHPEAETDATVEAIDPSTQIARRIHESFQRKKKNQSSQTKTQKNTQITSQQIYAFTPQEVRSLEIWLKNHRPAAFETWERLKTGNQAGFQLTFINIAQLAQAIVAFAEQELPQLSHADGTRIFSDGAIADFIATFTAEFHKDSQHQFHPTKGSNQGLPISWIDHMTRVFTKYFGIKAGEGRFGRQDYENFYTVGLLNRVAQEESPDAHSKKPSSAKKNQKKR